MGTTHTHHNDTPLQSLNNLKHYHVAEDSHDIRGWKVVGRKNDTIGVVDDLIVDPDRGKARYVTITTDKNIFADNTQRKILVPVGRTKVENDHKALMVDSLDQERVRFYPIYTGEPITRDYEYGLKNALHDSVDSHDTYDAHRTTHMASDHDDTTTRRTHRDGLESDDPLVRAQAERDVAKAERDIYKTRYEKLQHQLNSIRSAMGESNEDFYNNNDYDDTYYRNRYTKDETH